MCVWQPKQCGRSGTLQTVKGSRWVVIHLLVPIRRLRSIEFPTACSAGLWSFAFYKGWVQIYSYNKGNDGLRISARLSDCPIAWSSKGLLYGGICCAAKHRNTKWLILYGMGVSARSFRFWYTILNLEFNLITSYSRKCFNHYIPVP